MTNIPAQFLVGDTVKWTDSSFDGKGSADYTLTYTLVGPSKLTVTGVASGDGWDVTISASSSAGLTAGDYVWQAALTATGVKYTVGTGQLVVQKNISAQDAGYDGRTQAETDLAAVKAAIRARVSGDATVEYTIGNRSLKKEPLANLIALRTQLEADVAREKQAKRLSDGTGRAVFVRFGR